MSSLFFSVFRVPSSTIWKSGCGRTGWLPSCWSLEVGDHERTAWLQKMSRMLSLSSRITQRSMQCSSQAGFQASNGQMSACYRHHLQSHQFMPCTKLLWRKKVTMFLLCNLQANSWLVVVVVFFFNWIMSKRYNLYL